MSPSLKKGLHWAGSTLALAGIVFVALRLRDYGDQIDFGRFNLVAWLMIGGFALIYGLANLFGLANLLLALAWWNLLNHFGANTAKGWALKTFGISQLAKYVISQLAKYVPGNIFHLAGRQAIGMAAGLPGWPLVKSSTWELGLISFAGGIFGLLTLPLIAPAISVAVGFGLFAVTVAGVAALLRHYLGPLVASALGCYIGFLSISGMLFVGLVDLVSAHTEPDGLPWMSLCGAYVIAWLAGLVNRMAGWLGYAGRTRRDGGAGIGAVVST